MTDRTRAAVRAALLPLTLCLLGPGPASAAKEQKKADKAQETEYSGIALFRTYCSSCHGREAKGDGPLAEQLAFRPPDLTQLAKRLGGEFSAEKVFRIIDGRDPLKGHGGPNMPVWGDAFKSSREGYDEKSVKAKIQALVDYLASIQEQPAK